MAGRPQERHRLAGGPGDRGGPDGPPTALTSSTRRLAGGEVASPHGLLLAACASAAIIALAGARAALLGFGAPSIPVGAAFAASLLLPALLTSTIRRRLTALPHPRAVAMGAGLGVLLLTPGAWLLLSGHHAATSLHPAGLLAQWAPAVALVAAAEEVVLRAAIQPWLRSATGPAVAIVLTAAVFAAIHYPLYGADAMPLDLGVGILIGVLRQQTGSVAACWVAHAVADIGAWWLP